VTGAVGLFTGVCLLVGGVGASSIALIVVALATMGLGIGIAGAPVQTAAVESVPMGSTGAASGIFSTSRYIGSVVGSSILAGLFIVRPDEGDGALFVGLFVGLAVAALIGIAVNSRIADRHHESA
jgi:MFS family permease